MDDTNKKDKQTATASSIKSTGLLDLSYIAGYYGLKIGKTKRKNIITFQLAGTNSPVECESLFYNSSKDRWHIYKKKV